MPTAEQKHTPGKELDALVAERVMGIKLSATTSKDKASAVMDGFWSNNPSGDVNTMKFNWNGGEYSIDFIESYFNYKGMGGNAGYGLKVWEDRRGKDYQADLEAHVKEWRRHVRPYSTSISTAWEIVEAMKMRGWLIGVECQSRTLYRAWAIFGGPSVGKRPVFYEVCESAPLAICRAALSTVEAK